MLDCIRALPKTVHCNHSHGQNHLCTSSNQRFHQHNCPLLLLWRLLVSLSQSSHTFKSNERTHQTYIYKMIHTFPHFLLCSNMHSTPFSMQPPMPLLSTRLLRVHWLDPSLQQKKSETDVPSPRRRCQQISTLCWIHTSHCFGTQPSILNQSVTRRLILRSKAILWIQWLERHPGGNWIVFS